jgi:hypothetical protein
LKLDEKQMQQAEALISVYQAELKDLEQNTADLLQRLQDKAAEMQAARTAGDTERAKQLQEELRNLAPATQAETHFFDALSEILTSEQKGKLEAVRKQAETAGDVALHPVYVVRTARKLPLTPEQNKQLEKILDDYRTSVAAARAEKPELVEERVEQLIKNVRAALTPEQAAAYDKAIAELRENPPSVKPAQPAPPTTQPADQPWDTSKRPSGK